MRTLLEGPLLPQTSYLRRLDGFSEIQKLPPKDILSRSDRKISSLLMDFVSWREKHGDT